VIKGLAPSPVGHALMHTVRWQPSRRWVAIRVGLTILSVLADLCKTDSASILRRAA